MMEAVQFSPKFSLALQMLARNKHDSLRDAVLIFWTKVSPDEPKAKEQLATLNEAIKASKRLMIYDLSRSMTQEEAKWILKNGGELYEPYIQTRPGFIYLPEPVWFDVKNLSLELPKKEFFFGYYNKYPNRIICETLDVDPVLRDDFNYSYAIALDTEDDCRYGHIHMELIQGAMTGTKPLIPGAHRWFHGLVTEVSSPICKAKDLDWFKKTSGESYGYCHRFLEVIDNQFPEFKFNYFKDVLCG